MLLNMHRMATSDRKQGQTDYTALLLPGRADLPRS